jgi:guanylate kinase
MSGRFVVITGPSASGKTTLVTTLLARVPDSARLVTMTTRRPRPGEKDGIDYFFITREEFEERLEEDEFFEYAEVYGNLYGSSSTVLNDSLLRYSFVFAIIDVQGAKTLSSKLPETITIFLKPDSIEELKLRLEEERNGTPQEEMERRLATATHELTLAKDFDHIVVNTEGQLEKTIRETLRILGIDGVSATETNRGQR